MAERGNEARVIQCRYCDAKNRITPKSVVSKLFKVNCGSCKRPIFGAPDEPLHQIASAAYEHPLDRKALDMLKRIPGVNTLLRFLLKELSERRMYMFYQQTAVKVTSSHLERLYHMADHSSRLLDLDYIPQVFVMNDPHPNAMAIGVDEPFIVLTTSLLDSLDEQQVAGVIGHEVGHIKAGHQLYRTALYLIVNVADRMMGSMIPFRDAALQAIYHGLLYWSRCSELTADRAQMLVQRDFDGYVACEMRMAGGSAYTNPMLDAEQFLKQADESLTMQEESFLNKLYASMQSAGATHPFPVWRVGHMHEWVMDGSFLDIMSGTYLREIAEGGPMDIDLDEEEKERPKALTDLLNQWRGWMKKGD